MANIKSNENPQSLHLARLAQGSPNQWVILPNSPLKVIQLTGKLQGPQVGGYLVCLSGELVLDLPKGQYVRLCASESYQIKQQEPWLAFPTKGQPVLLLLETVF